MRQRSVLSIAVATTAMTITLATGCSSTSASVEAFCAKLEEFASIDITLDGDPTVLDGASQSLAELADVSPDEVKPSVEVLARALDTMSRAAAQAGSDSAAALDAAIGALTPDLGVVEQASAEIEVYAEANCGISLTDSSDTVEPS
jgi:cell division protein FtsX